MATYREDYVGKAAFQDTPQGGVRCDSARLTRTGVLLYTDPASGKTRRELRHPNEVFHEDSLASLKGAPVTIGHPAVITPENFKDNSSGHTGDDVHRDGQFVSATLYVQDATAVEGVRSKKLVELSCGYYCDFDPTPGIFDGQPYDGVQRNIRYNHVGMGPSGWGRAGSDVRIRHDGRYSLCEMDPEKLQARIDGLVAELATVKAELASTKSERDRAAGERDALKTETEKLRTDGSPAAFEARVQARLALVQDAKSVLPDADFTKKSDREVLEAVVASTKKDFRADGLSNDYLRGQFDRIVLTAKDVADHNAKTREALEKGGRQDGNPDEDKIAAAQKRQRERDENLWKGTDK